MQSRKHSAKQLASRTRSVGASQVHPEAVTGMALRTGWWVLIALIPAISGIILLIFMVLDSEPGANEYELNPKAGGSSLTA